MALAPVSMEFVMLWARGRKVKDNGKGKTKKQQEEGGKRGKERIKTGEEQVKHRASPPLSHTTKKTMATSYMWIRV